MISMALMDMKEMVGTLYRNLNLHGQIYVL